MSLTSCRKQAMFIAALCSTHLPHEVQSRWAKPGIYGALQRTRLPDSMQIVVSACLHVHLTVAPPSALYLHHDASLVEGDVQNRIVKGRVSRETPQRSRRRRCSTSIAMSESAQHISRLMAPESSNRARSNSQAFRHTLGSCLR